jgi:zinc-finger-containing domain
MTCNQTIYCCGCRFEVQARLTDGSEIYPHRPDLHHIPFWKCDTCKNYVGCHWKTKDRTRPLGNIPTREIMNARKHIHAILDPIWKAGKSNRRELYGKLSSRLGYEYHTGEIKDVGEARKIYAIIKEMAA